MQNSYANSAPRSAKNAPAIAICSRTITAQNARTSARPVQTNATAWISNRPQNIYKSFYHKNSACYGGIFIVI
jgi:hypothetical protein